MCRTLRQRSLLHEGGRNLDIVRTKPADPEKNEIAIQEACDCPSGRLVMVDKKTGQEIEPEFEPSISVVEDETTGLSGPIWVKGKIQIEGSDGTLYELRNPRDALPLRPVK